MDKPITLLIPGKTDVELERVSAAWRKSGGKIKRLEKFWIRDDELVKQRIAIYGNQAFAFVLAQIYNVELVSPADLLITKLDQKWIKRKIEVNRIGEMTQNDFPTFIKPVVPKLFLAAIFQSLPDFKQATIGMTDTEKILSSDIVNDIEAEARSYVMDGIVKDIALYEGSADLASGKKFLTEFLESNRDLLPEVVVIDIALSEKKGWLILEFNACWGAGLNNCNAEKVIQCIINATINK